MGNVVARGCAFVTGSNQSRPGGQRRAEVIVLPIQAIPAKRSKRLKKRPGGGNRSIQITRGLASGDLLRRLNELRNELECIEEAILALERLAISRFPARRGRTSKAGGDSLNFGYGRG
jgi:hypothetical protein